MRRILLRTLIIAFPPLLASCGIAGSTASFGSEEPSTDETDLHVVADLFGPGYFSAERGSVRDFVIDDDEEKYEALIRAASLGELPEATDLLILDTEIDGDSAKVQYGGKFCYFEPVESGAAPPTPNEEVCEIVTDLSDEFAPRAVIFFERGGGDKWRFDLDAQVEYEN